MSTLDQQARDVLRHYPRIYVACHTDHAARRGQGVSLTARDQTILAHIADDGVRARALAQHLAVSPSTLSAALKRLVELGVATSDIDPKDARGKIVRLTARGRAAIEANSVLNIARVRGAVKRLDAEDRILVVRGLALLADACAPSKE